jgi:hypothetical protein
MNDQLFDAGGPVKIIRSKNNLENAKRRKQEIVKRLVGEGIIRQDPLTGKWYDLENGALGTSLKRAYRYQCRQCGASYLRGAGRERRGNHLCRDCSRYGLPDGTRKQNANGYVELKIDGQWRLEHRVVMETELGRPLLDSETVHHINGARSDNRPENLQLRRGQHGAGQAHVCLDCGSHNVVAVPIAD